MMPHEIESARRHVGSDFCPAKKKKGTATFERLLVNSFCCRIVATVSYSIHRLLNHAKAPLQRVSKDKQYMG